MAIFSIRNFAIKQLMKRGDDGIMKMPSQMKADFAEAGDEDVFRKIKSDLESFNISDDEIRSKMNEMNEKAKKDFN